MRLIDVRTMPGTKCSYFKRVGWMLFLWEDVDVAKGSFFLCVSVGDSKVYRLFPSSGDRTQCVWRYFKHENEKWHGAILEEMKCPSSSE